MRDRKSATKRTREATAPLADDRPGGTSVGIRELRDHLSRYLDLVKGGAPVTVTDHGRVIATIVPMRFPERTMELYRQGKVNLPTLPKGNPADFHRIDVEGGMQDILKDVRGG
jgi:prevent-host-death family protein